jgi:hypothetical protein
VQTWRDQSSEAREKAEKERKRWEEVRALEREEATRRNAEVSEVAKDEHEAGWETVLNSRKTESIVLAGLPVGSRGLREVHKPVPLHGLC